MMKWDWGRWFWLRFAPVREVRQVGTWVRFRKSVVRAARWEHVLKWAGWDVNFVETVHLLAFSCITILGARARIIGLGFWRVEVSMYRPLSVGACVCRVMFAILTNTELNASQKYKKLAMIRSLK
jgi:hypothetical protein